MSRIKRRTATWTLEGGGKQVYTGPGTILYASMDGTSLSSSVLTMYDGFSTAGATAGTWTQDTDFGTTVPVAVFSSGSIVATMGTSSADTHIGIPFSQGLFINKTGDTTNSVTVNLLIKPLIRKNVTIGGKGATTDTQSVFDGPGILHAVSIRTDVGGALTTADLLFKDKDVDGTSGKTLWTATNYVTTSRTIRRASTTTGIDNAGTATTTAATGAYANPGIAFMSGLQITAAQLSGTVGLRSHEVDCLIEA